MPTRARFSFPRLNESYGVQSFIALLSIIPWNVLITSGERTDLPKFADNYCLAVFSWNSLQLPHYHAYNLTFCAAVDAPNSSAFSIELVKSRSHASLSQASLYSLSNQDIPLH